MENKYKDILKELLTDGEIKTNRGEYFSIYGKNFSHDLETGFPMLTGRKIFQKNFIHEFIWMLSGSSSIKYLNDNNVSIWDSWADTQGSIGPSYGYQLRSFNNEIDQFKKVIEDLKKDPYSRRHIISLWNPLQLNQIILPPCYHTIQFIITGAGKLNIIFNMRSCDFFVGFPYDICVASLFNIVVSHELGIKPGSVYFHFGDLHIYKNQTEQILEYFRAETFALPKITYIGELSTIKSEDFMVLNYKHSKHLKTKITI